MGGAGRAGFPETQKTRGSGSPSLTQGLSSLGLLNKMGLAVWVFDSFSVLVRVVLL